MANQNQNGRNVSLPDENRPSWRPHDQMYRGRGGDDERWRDREGRDEEQLSGSRGRSGHWDDHNEGYRGADRDQGRSFEDRSGGGMQRNQYWGDRSERSTSRGDDVGSERGYGNPQGYGQQSYGQGYNQGYGQQSYGQGGYGQRGGMGNQSVSNQGMGGRSVGGQGYGSGQGYTGYGGQGYGGEHGGYQGGGYQGGGYQGGGYQGGYGGQDFGGQQGNFGNQGTYGGYGNQGMGHQGYGGQHMGGQGGMVGQGLGGNRMSGGLGRDIGGGSHRGKGPQGYTRSDERIREQVCEVLADDDNVDASNIEVTVRNGEVVLSGTVEDRHSKRIAEDIVERCSGVKDVQNQIKVQDRRERGSQQISGNPSGSQQVGNKQEIETTTGSSTSQDKRHRA